MLKLCGLARKASGTELYFLLQLLRWRYLVIGWLFFIFLLWASDSGSSWDTIKCVCFSHLKRQDSLANLGAAASLGGFLIVELLGDQVGVGGAWDGMPGGVRP